MTPDARYTRRTVLAAAAVAAIAVRLAHSHPVPFHAYYGDTHMIVPMPDKVVATYFTLWSGGMRITEVPASYNQIYLFHCIPNRDGSVNFEYPSAVSAAEVNTCQSRGQRCVLTFGGANAGFNFQNRTQSQTFLNSITKLIDSLSVSGLDFNNFEANVGSSPTEMIWIAQQLKGKYGYGFSITCPPAPGAGYAPMDRTLTKAMAQAGVLDYAGPQFYDSSDLTTESILLQLIPEWVSNVGSAGHVAIGAGSNYSDGAPTATTVSAWKKLIAKYPDLRGVYGWSAQDDKAKGWSFGSAIAAAVGAQPVPAPIPTPTPPSPTPTPTPPTPSGVAVVSAPVPQRKGFTRRTDTLRCTATIKAGSSDVGITEAVITARPPGGTHSGGPYNDLSPAAEPQTLKAGQTLSLKSTRRFKTSDKAGTWVVYATYQAADGSWHDGPEVTINVK